jgi:hypothetical protein
MALGKTPLLVLGGLAGVAALYYGYNLYSDKQTVNNFEERKEKVVKKLEDAPAAEKAREEAVAKQSGMEGLKAVPDAPIPATAPKPGGALDAKTAVNALNAKISASAADGAPIPGAKNAGMGTGAAKNGGGKNSASAPGAPPTSREQLAAENAHLLTMLNGDKSRAGSVKAGAPAKKTTEIVIREEPTQAPAPAKLEMRDAEMVPVEDAQPEAPAPKKRKAPRRALRLPPRATILSELKQDAELGLGTFTAKWTDKYGSASWSELAAIAGDASQDVGLRYFSLQAAIEIGGRDSADGITKLLSDKNPGIRCLSLLGLGEMGDKELAPKFIPLLKDRAMVVRECALTATVRAQGQDSVGQVLSMISDPINYNRGHPLSIVKRGFELLDAMGASSSLADACQALKDRTNPSLYRDTTKRWSVCAQSVEGSLTPTSAGR